MLRSTMPTLEIMALLKPDQAKETCTAWPCVWGVWGFGGVGGETRPRTTTRSGTAVWLQQQHPNVSPNIS